MRAGGDGGAKTLSGLRFEEKADLLHAFEALPGYEIYDNGHWKEIVFEKRAVGKYFKKHQLYTFLKMNGIDWKSYLSSQLLPDNALYVYAMRTIYIIEIKFQKTTGSVDEKLQTCDFKRKQYLKLFKPLGLRSEYIYLLNDWFGQERYRDTLDYIEMMGCRYYFDTIALPELGLPVKDM